MTLPEDERPFPAASEEVPRPRTADELLPPVEPPSAAFLLQLFVVPAVIVIVIVAVWMMFGWIASRSSATPEDIIARIEGSGEDRWQRAGELADMLRNPQQVELKQDSAAAARLAELLDSRIDAAAAGGGMEEKPVALRYFLCRALGEFHVADGIDVLIKAANTSRDPREQTVRRGAIEALAVLAHGLQENNVATLSDLARMEAALLGLSRDPDPLIRSATAYALGQLGTPEAVDRLVVLADNPHVDTRYNAATGLAAHGRIEAVPTLAEMLDPTATAGIEEELEDARSFKRATIMTNALRAVEQLHTTHPEGDFTPVKQSLEAIVAMSPDERQAAYINRQLVFRADEVLTILRDGR